MRDPDWMFWSKCPRGPVREEQERTRLLQDVVRDGVRGRRLLASIGQT